MSHALFMQLNELLTAFQVHKLNEEHQGSSAVVIRPSRASCFLCPNNSEELWRCNLPMMLARSSPSWFTLVVIRSWAWVHSSMRFLLDQFGNRIFNPAFYSDLTVIKSPTRLCFHDATHEFGISLSFVNKAESN
jgi:hypothetical protein